MATQNRDRPTFSPHLGMAAGMVAVSTAAIATRSAQREASSLSIAAWRLALASLLLAPIVLTRYRDELARLNRFELVRASAAGFMLALHFTTWISSLEFTSVAASAALVSTHPLFVGLLSPILLKERVSPLMMVGILLVVVGSGVISLDSEGSESDPLWGDLLALIGAACVAGYMMIGRTLRSRLSLLAYIFLVYGMATIAQLTIVLLSGQPVARFTLETYGWLFYLAIGPQLVGHSSFNWALRYLSAAFVTVAMLVEPTGATLLAWVVLKEPPTRPEVLGGTLILFGVVVAFNSEHS